MKAIEKAQNLLPLGYIFLVVLGIIKESVFYHQIGINILKYSSIMDVLISPIATLTLDPIILIFFVLIFGFVALLPNLLRKLHHQKWVRKALDLDKKDQTETEEEIKKGFVNISMLILAVMLLSFFLGFGIGSGHNNAKNIKSGKLDYNYKLNYNSGEAEDIYLVGSNSLYYFFVAKGNPAVKIAPIGAIKSIELTHNRAFK